jgi:plastocyanin
MLALIAIATSTAFLPLIAGPGEPREVEITIRDMAFHVAGESAPNPTLTMSAGETVVLVVRNEDAGILHDFSVPAWDSATPKLRAGESHRIVFTAPDEKGTTTYQCTPHSVMMKGTLVVR